MSPSSPFIHRPIATSLLMFAILLSGLLSFQLLPVSALPDVDYPTIRVSVFYPGASPDVIASGITAPLERQLGQMPGLNQMTSSSSTGASIITLQFSLNMSLDVAEQEVQAAINAAQTYLPSNLPTPPIYSKVNPADTPILTLALTSKTLPLSKIEDLADTRFAQKISQLPGVGLVSISGGQRPAVRIQVNPNALAAYGITLENVRSTILASNVNTPKGNFDGKDLAYTINANDQLLKSEDYQSLIIAYQKGAPVRLMDIAAVADNVENTKLAAWMNLEPAVILNIQRQPGSNVIEVVDRIKQLLPKLHSTLPKAVDVSILSDRTVSIRSSVAHAQIEMMISIVLVVLVIFLFLRNLPATVIPSISVPLSLIGSLGVMYLFGFSLNNLTIMALTIATGFVIDDAIVMIENISRYVEKGESSLNAALKGAKQIGFTIMSLTVSLIAVLIPLLFMKEIIGRLFREFAITLSVTILISGFVSLTLTPMLCSRFLHHREPDEASKFEQFSKKMLDRLIERYGETLKIVFNHQSLILIITVITLGMTLLLFYLIPKGFFPIQDTGIIQGISEAPQSISFAEMSKRQQELVRGVLQDPSIESVSSFIGIDGTNTTLNRGRILMALKPIEKRDISAADIIRNLQPKLAEIPGITLYMQPVQDISIEDRISLTQYQYSLGSAYSEEVSLWGTRLLEKLKNAPVLQDVAIDLQNKGLQAKLTYDRNTASRFGITPQMIDDTLYDAFGQRQISTMFTQLNQYHVILEVLPELQRGPVALNNIYLNASNGKPIPLSTFTTLSQETGSVLINRQGQFPVATLSFNLAPGAALGDAVTVINNAKQELNIPDSVQTNFEGVAKIFQNSLKNEGWLILAAIMVVYIVLGVLYESYIHPVTILSTLPSATLGALLALRLTNNELSIIALIGIILLIGIVMKNAIMMIDFALELERVNKKAPLDAIYEACLLRFRPIVMTTCAAMLGAVPLAFGSGMGSELRQPLGIAIIGGLIVSQLLTLYTTPVIYLTFDKMSRAVRSRWFNQSLLEPGGL